MRRSPQAADRNRVRTRRRLLAPLVLAGALVAFPGNAFAFCQTTTASAPASYDPSADGCFAEGIPLAWTGRCVGYSLNIEGTATLTADQWTEALNQAFTVWGDVDCGGGNPPSIDLLQLADVSCAKSDYNPSGPNANVVYFDDNGWSPEDGNIDATLALTTVHFSDSGDILGADMAFNSGRHDFTVGDQGVQQDLMSIATHEVGHFLGLAHSPNIDAVMYYGYAQGSIKRTLTADDSAAICAVYPPGRQATCNPIPNGGLRSNCNSDVGSAGGCAAAGRNTAGGNDGLWSMLFAIVALASSRGTAKRRRWT